MRREEIYVYQKKKKKNERKESGILNQIPNPHPIPKSCLIEAFQGAKSDRRVEARRDIVGIKMQRKFVQWKRGPKVPTSSYTTPRKGKKKKKSEKKKMKKKVGDEKKMAKNMKR